MRKLLLLALLSIFIACSNLEGLGFTALAAACRSAPAPWHGFEELAQPVAAASVATPQRVLRTVTYNIHSGMGQWKGLWSSRATVERYLDGIAEAIAGTDTAPVDVVALNEVDFAARRSGDIDQARHIADALERITGARYEVIYGETRKLGFPGFKGGFGNAVLVRHTITEQHACLYENAQACGLAGAADGLPSLRAPGTLMRLVREARGLIKLTLDVEGRPIDVIVTHLEALATPEREAQAAHLLQRFVDPGRTTIVLGDMNAVPTMMTYLRHFAGTDRTHDILTSGSLADARVLIDMRLGRRDFGAWSTFPAVAPIWPLDVALGSLDLLPLNARVMDALHSDHRGLYVAYGLLNDTAAIDSQRRRHDAIRARQLAHILQCDITDATRTAKLHWLHTATRFLDPPAPRASVVSEL